MNILTFILEGFKLAWQAINGKRTRTFLTTLGVATGIFTISGILTLVNSMQSSVTENLSALGNTTLMVHHWPWKDNSDDWYRYFNRPKVSYRDFDRLSRDLDNVEGVAYVVTANRQSARRKGREMSNISLVGVTADLPLISDLEFSEGRFFSEMEHHLGSGVCVIGYNLGENLFPGQNPIGKDIRVGSKQMIVVGLIEKQGATMFGGSDDDKVYVPYKTLARMVNMNQRSVDKMISIKASSRELLDEVEAETIGIIRAARGLKPKVEDNFAINKQESLMAQVDQIFGILESGGLVISLFSVLIAAFSIGMIMYISVKERTKEIGIQKALGATKGFILFQFLIEALLICIGGGLVGLFGVFLLGEVITFFLTRADIALTIALDTGNILMGLGLSLSIGLLAGIFPAGIAASVDPVIAIREG